MTIGFWRRTSRMIHIASILSQFRILCFKHLNILLHSLIHLVRLLYLLPQLKNVPHFSVNNGLIYCCVFEGGRPPSELWLGWQGNLVLLAIELPAFRFMIRLRYEDIDSLLWWPCLCTEEWQGLGVFPWPIMLRYDGRISKAWFDRAGRGDTKVELKAAQLDD